jgi:hypothetical protein
MMKRTQVQLPDGLYDSVRRVAESQEWSITEVLRRGAEYMVRCYPSAADAPPLWRLPKARALGAFRAPVDRWRELAAEAGERAPG